MMALALAFQLRSLDMVVPRNLRLSTTSIRWPSINKGSTGVLLLWKCSIIFLVFEGLRFRLLLLHYDTRLRTFS